MSAESVPTPTPVPVGWEPDLNTFGARLALIRQRLRWNVKEAAVACGIAPQSWRQWEAGMSCRNQEQVARQVADVTGCNYLWLFAGPNPVPDTRRRSVVIPDGFATIRHRTRPSGTLPALDVARAAWGMAQTSPRTLSSERRNCATSA